MRIPDETLQEIRSRLSMVDVVGRHVPLKRAGKNWKGLCPFHVEKTPSFVVNEERGTYHCFGCGAGGNVFRFVMEVEGRSFPEAAQILAATAGVTLDLGPESAAARQDREERSQLLEVLELAARYYRHQLVEGRAGERARAYLARREVPPGAAEGFRLGCAPAGWNNLLRYLGSKGVEPALASRAGLLAERTAGGHYDRLRDRLVFPISDTSGRVVSFGGRVLGEGEPKYLNGPESSVFRKGELLYGLYEGREALRAGGPALLVEGYMDVISLHARGFGNALATLGTALTADHVRVLRRWTNEAVLIYDGDAAGRRAAFRSLEVFLSEGLACRAVLLPPEHDPDSLVRGGGDLAGLVADASPLMELFLEHTVAQLDLATVEGRLTAVDEVLPVLRAVADPLARDLYLEQAADRLGVPSGRLRERVERGRAGAARREERPRRDVPDPADPVEQAVLDRLVLEPACRSAFLASGADTWMKPGALREAARFVARRAEGPESLPVDELPAAPRRLLTAVLVDDSRPTPPAYEALAAKLRMRHLEERIRQAVAGIREAETAGDDPRVLHLLSEKAELDREMEQCRRTAAARR